MEIKNKSLANMAIDLSRCPIFNDFEYITYTGDNALNYLTVMLATFLKGKTFVIGNNENIEAIDLKIVKDNEMQNNLSTSRDLEITDVIKIINKQVNSQKISLVMSTSGSTNSPKSVAFTYCEMLYRINLIVKEYNLTKQVKELVVLPITASAIILAQILPTLWSGGQLVILSKFNIVEIMNELYKNYDYTGLTPTVLKFLKEFNIDWSKIKVKNIAIGGEKIDFDELEIISSKTDNSSFFPMYGLTESGGAIVGVPNDKKRPKNSIGKTYKGVEAKINNGVIYFKDPGMGKGYLINGKVVDFRDEHGWLNTGDLGNINTDGYLFITGRVKDIIIVGGVNVYPSEIKKVINKCPGIVDCNVYGVSDKYTGERVVAKVLISKNSHIDVKTLKNFVANRLESMMIPKDWTFTENAKIIGLGKGRYSGK